LIKGRCLSFTGFHRTAWKICAESNYLIERHRRREKAGVATGLAWTEAGGQIIFVEAAGMSIKN